MNIEQQCRSWNGVGCLHSKPVLAVENHNFSIHYYLINLSHRFSCLPSSLFIACFVLCLLAPEYLPMLALFTWRFAISYGSIGLAVSRR